VSKLRLGKAFSIGKLIPGRIDGCGISEGLSSKQQNLPQSVDKKKYGYQRRVFICKRF
jgi:hypothetical protein